MITKDDAIQALRDLVAERGADYVYPEWNKGACKYAIDGKPSCIVGHVVAKLDPELFKEFAAQEKYGAFGIDEVRLDAFEDDEGNPTPGNYVKWADRFEADAIPVLSVAQGQQDSGVRWGDAVKAALEFSDNA